MSSTTEQIKERLGIVDVVGDYVKLEKAGSSFKAKCPFHHEKTPSFFVSPTRSTYYCFGCGERGDIFSFVEQFEGIDFKSALKLLADKAGVEIVYEKQEDKQAKQILFDVLEKATQFFESNIDEHSEAQAYLKGRALSDEFVSWFRIGYAQDSWNSLHDYLKERGYTDEVMLNAGLIKKGDKGLYDTFRSRIMFPINDATGRVVAFSGRIFPVSADDKVAKYLNSPETELFSKSNILFAFDKAKLSIRKANFAILVEGQMDVVMAHQAGFKNTVALSGTALTSQHVTLLKRLSLNLVLAFDADKAGIASSGRSATIALALGLDVKVARLPLGVDPADLVKEDPEKLREVIRGSVHIITFYLDMLGGLFKDKRAFNMHVEKQVLPFIARIESKIDQMHFVGEVARRIGIPEEAIYAEVVRITEAQNSEPHTEATAKETQTNQLTPSLSKKEMLINQIFGILFALKEKKDSDVIISDFEKQFEDIIGTEFFKKMKKTPELFEEEIFFMTDQSSKHLEESIVDDLRSLQRIYLEEKRVDIRTAVHDTEHAGNETAHNEALQALSEISKEIELLK